MRIAGGVGVAIRVIWDIFLFLCFQDWSGLGLELGGEVAGGKTSDEWQAVLLTVRAPGRCCMIYGFVMCSNLGQARTWDV